MTPRVVASQPDFELQSLGWKAFQSLCHAVTSEVLGQSVQAFHASRDGGRDGAFHGLWKNSPLGELEGSFTVQCKFSARDTALTAASLKDEIAKAGRLAKKGLAKHYILMTSCRLAAVDEAPIRERYMAVEGIETCLIFGREWIAEKILASPTLRLLVPRVYGLGDLSQILDERAYVQADRLLRALSTDLKKFVITAAYSRAATALIMHGFVLLLGEPAAGKSTIAATLAVGALDKWGCGLIKVRSADEFIRHWNPVSPSQLFWIDDAFGVTQLEQDLVAGWRSTWPQVDAAIRGGTRVILTSRDYVYHAARPLLKRSAFPLLNEAQVVIDVRRLTTGEREQILYNHVKLGNQGRTFRRAIKPYLARIAANGRFLPEIARRLGNTVFTKHLNIDERAIRRFVEEPVDFLIEVVEGLDPASRAALALVFMRSGTLTSPITLTPNEEAALSLLGVTAAQARQALPSLEGSLVSFSATAEGGAWTFRHPTIGDAYATIVMAEPELLEIYLKWTDVQRIMREVTCGDVGVEGVKVIVPPALYEVIHQRLDGVEFDGALLGFLSLRCSVSFLRRCLERRPEIDQALMRPRWDLRGVAAALAVKLHESGLLSEECRRGLTEYAEERALEADLSYWSDSNIQRLLTSSERAAAVQLMRAEVVPILKDVIASTAESWNEEGDPWEWFGSVRETIAVLRGLYEDSGVLSRLAEAEEYIAYRVQALLDEMGPEPDDDDRWRGSGGDAEERSVFDDVDE